MKKESLTKGVKDDKGSEQNPSASLPLLPSVKNRTRRVLTDPPNWLAGGGEMGKLVAAKDWSQTRLGPVESWPQALKTAVCILLNSRYPMFIWWGRELTNIYNDAYVPMLGARHPEALGRSAPDIWADVWPVVGPQAEQVLNEGRATWNESILLVMERYGYTEEAYFTFSYSPAPDDTGAVGGVFCAVTEDTGRVLGERRLETLRNLGERSLAEAKTAEEACRNIATALAENRHDLPFALIYLLDGESKRARLCETVNLSAGMKASLAAVDLDSDDDVWNFRRVLETKHSQIVENLEETFGRLPAGPWADDWTKRTLVLPLAKPGQEFLDGFLVTGLSPRLAFGDAYRSFLELVAGQIAAAIANARAYDAERKRAETLAELDRAKTAFFSNVSHEFRTPLTLLLGPIEDELHEDPENPRLELAHRNCLRLLKLVNTLLDFSRIEAGRIQASYEPAELSVVTSDLASTFRSAIEKAGLKLTLDCPPLPEPVYVDQEMWEKIVLNLLSNAFKFTFEGEIMVTLRWCGERVELSVSDTGVGIPAAELPRVFERFHRVPGARSRTHEGTGIGLSLVQELARLHGGEVKVQSVQGRGSTFTVSIQTGKAHLPTDRIGAQRNLASTSVYGKSSVTEALRWLPVEQGSADIPPVVSGARGVARPAESSARILLADDNADMRAYVQRLLGKVYQIEAVPDGQAALEAVHAHPPDLVLADVMMPRLDGFGLLKELRAHLLTRSIPVIMLSARAGEEARVEGLEQGADDYLIKPFSARELMARVSARLELARVQRAAAAEVERTEQRLRLFIEHAPAAIAMFDRQMRYVAVSARWRADYHLAGELTGKSHYDVFPEIPARWKEVHQRALLGEVSQMEEDRFERADGTVQWLKWEVLPWHDNSQEVGGIIIATEEITDRRKGDEALRQSNATLAQRLAELQDSRRAALNLMADAVQARDAARQSEERFRTLFELGPVAVYSCDAAGVIQTFNRRAAELWGRTPAPGDTDERFCGSFRLYRPDGTFMPHEQWPMGEVLSGKLPGMRDAEMIIERPDGSRATVVVNIRPLTDEQGEITGAINCFYDVTERKHADEVRAKLAAIVESSDDAIVSKDLNGVITSWNRGAQQLFGYTRQEAVGQPVTMLIPPEHLDEEPSILERIRRGESIDHYETVRRRKDGTLLDISLTISPIRNDQGRVVGASKIARDISHRKRNEEALRQAQTLLADRAGQLEQAVAERTGELSATNKQLEAFAYSVAHDLRAPVRSMEGFSAMLLEEAGASLSETGQDFAKRINRAAQFMDALLMDLLTFSSTAQQRIELAPVRLETVVRSVLSRLEKEIQDTKARVETSGSWPTVLAHEPTLGQVLFNLVSNALKFVAPEARPVVRVRAEEARSGAEGRVRVEVEDEGIGIPPEYQEQVFRLFARLHGERYPGTGVGLAIVQKGIERMGGRVGVESTPGQGSCFWFELRTA